MFVHSLVLEHLSRLWRGHSLDDLFSCISDIEVPARDRFTVQFQGLSFEWVPSKILYLIEYSSTSILVNSFRDHAETEEYWMMKHILLWDGIVTHTNSSKCDESGANAKCWIVFFLVKMPWVQCLMISEPDEYWGITVFAISYPFSERGFPKLYKCQAPQNLSTPSAQNFTD